MTCPVRVGHLSKTRTGGVFAGYALLPTVRNAASLTGKAGRNCCSLATHPVPGNTEGACMCMPGGGLGHGHGLLEITDRRPRATSPGFRCSTGRGDGRWSPPCGQWYVTGGAGTIDGSPNFFWSLLVAARHAVQCVKTGETSPAIDTVAARLPQQCTGCWSRSGTQMTGSPSPPCAPRGTNGDANRAPKATSCGLWGTRRAEFVCPAHCGVTGTDTDQRPVRERADGRTAAVGNRQGVWNADAVRGPRPVGSKLKDPSLSKTGLN